MKAFHEWVEVDEVSEALPTFTTSDIGHFFIVGEVDEGEEGELLPFSQPCEGGRGAWRGSWDGLDATPRLAAVSKIIN